MTKKLYYEDSYRKDFEGKVVGCEAYKEGFTVVLDQTAFYPEGGGQPADGGFLEVAGKRQAVKHVFIKEEVIYHVVEEAVAVGERAKGEIDFKKRFDFMQQHSGEHIVSGLVNQLHGYHNVGFHLSTDYMTADFDGELSQAQIEEIERLSNQAIYENQPVRAEIFESEAIQNQAYRSKLELKGKVRLVTIPHYDVCACCGTHVSHAGEIGLIKCIAAERHRGGMRLTLLCGERALKDYHMKQEILSEVGAKLSSKAEKIVEHTEKLQSELGLYKQRLSQCMTELFTFKAKAYAQTEEAAICVYEAALSGDELRKLCVLMTEQTQKPCLVLTGEAMNYKYALGSSAEDMRALAKEMNGLFAGRGGGSKELCQGSLSGQFSEIQEFLKQKALS